MALVVSEDLEGSLWYQFIEDCTMQVQEGPSDTVSQPGLMFQASLHKQLLPLPQ